MRHIITTLLFALLFISCGDSKKQRTITLLQEWEGKMINFPSRAVFTIQGKDTLEYHIQNVYKILTYVDSTGCTSCKLRFSEWNKFMAVVDSTRPNFVQFLFFLYPKNGMEIYQALRVERFNHPICIDEKDSLNKLNHFPSDMTFQTFLLDRENRVIAIGNPVHNPKVKELYLKIIRGENVEQEKNIKVVNTEVDIDKTFVSLGEFDWQKEQKTTFKLKNTGSKPLVIQDVNTSCGSKNILLAGFGGFGSLWM